MLNSEVVEVQRDMGHELSVVLGERCANRQSCRKVAQVLGRGGRREVSIHTRDHDNGENIIILKADQEIMISSPYPLSFLAAEGL